MRIGEDRFWVKEGKNFKLLCRDDRNLYLVTMGKKPNTARENALFGLAVSQLAAQSEIIPLQMLQGVGYGKLEAGNLLYLCLGRGQRPLILCSFLSRDYLTQFFPGIDLLLISEKTSLGKNHPGSWRAALCDPQKLEHLKWVEYATALLGGLAAFGFFFWKSLPWLCLCALSVLIPVILDICMPAYFSLEQGNKYRGSSAIQLLTPLLLVSLSLLFAGRQYSFFSWKLLKLSLLCAAGCAALILLAQEFRRHKLLLVGAFLWATILSIGFLQQANVLLPQPEPQTSTAQVVRLWQDRNYGRYQQRRVYYCTVLLPDGSLYTVSVDKELFAILETGYAPTFRLYSGAFHMEYYTLSVWEEEIEPVD